MVTSLPLQLRAEGVTTPCDKVIAASEAYISTCNETIDKYKVLTQEQDKLILKLTEQRNELAQATPGLPFYFWIILGAGSYAIIDQVRR